MSQFIPWIQPAGDAALVVEVGKGISPELRDRVKAWNRAITGAGLPGLIETVPSYRSVLVTYDPLVTDFERLTPMVASLRPGEGAGEASHVVEVPVCYGGDQGPDLPEVASRLGMSEDEVAALHSGTEYPVYMLGFMPGFAYLGGLPEKLRIPRLSTPRARVPRGSVAIAGEQTGVYPLETPGGWHLIGRTPVSLWNPASEDAFLIGPNAVVRFVPIGVEEYVRLDAEREQRNGQNNEGREGRGAEAEEPGASPSIEILNPGLFTTVQDLGRFGFAAFGLTSSGAADQFAHAVANRLVGNADSEATLEVTAVGPRLRFHRTVDFAVAGAEFDLFLDGQAVPSRASIRAQAGQELRFGPLRRGFRAYLAFAGGVDVPSVMGSRSTLNRATLGGYRGRALKTGDAFLLGPAEKAVSAGAGGPALGTVPAAWFDYLEARTIRAVPGPQHQLFSSLEPFFNGDYTVKPDSDRMGVRLDGPRLSAPGGHDIVSDGIALGSVQVPADGNPIIMLADHQTAGGYPKPATVITADLRILAQKRPGDRIRFAPAGAAQGAAARRDMGALLERASGAGADGGRQVLRWSIGRQQFVASVEPLE